jgi:hypothetical protein
MEEIMSLIDRYILEVGRHLPRKNRSDIQAELRSLLTDSLEDRAGTNSSESDVVALLKEFGAPRKVAASYYPEGQYLIGPALYPLFRLVAGFVLAAVVGAQVLVLGINTIIAEEPFRPLWALSGVVGSIPAALGMLVIIFAILQWFEVRPGEEEDSWDPTDLPQLAAAEPVKRGERIFGIVMGVVILAVLFLFRGNTGFVYTAEAGVVAFFVNPVIGQYILWISLAILVGIGLDIYLLRQGQWQTSSRILKIGVNILSITILSLLVQEHSSWLAERGAGGFFSTLAELPEDIKRSGQILGMQAFRMGFAIAAIVTTVETAIMLFRLGAVTLTRDARSKAIRVRKA